MRRALAVRRRSRASDFGPADAGGTACRGLTACLLVGALLSALPGQTFAAWTQTEFVIGSSVDPDINTSSPVWNAENVRLARDAYFNLFTGYHQGEGGSWFLSKLDVEAAGGLRGMASDNEFSGHWDYRRPYTPAAGEAVFSDYRNLSEARKTAFLGYVLWDEPWFNSPESIQDIKDWSRAMHLEDIARNDGHDRAVWVNLNPGCLNPNPCYPDYVAALLADPDPLRIPDVAGTDLYPFFANHPWLAGPYFHQMKHIRQAMQGRSFWIITKLDEAHVGPHGNGGGASMTPDDNMLRLMALNPVAAGAKGILWFTYRNECLSSSCTDAAVNEGGVLTYKYGWVRTVNHYLQDVVGPLVMSSTHVGLFHQTPAPSGAFDIEPDDLLSGSAAQLTPVVSLGNDSLAVGIFQKPGPEYFLLVVNKTLRSQAGTVQLRGGPYTITRSPSIVNYVGGTTYDGIGSGSSFSVSLAGGEGRLFRLTTGSAPTLTLTSPSGGEFWVAGQSKIINWQGSAGAPDILLYTDALENGPEITGPHVTLATAAPGSQATVVVPGVLTNRGRVVLRWSDAAGEHRISHNRPLTVGSPSVPSASVWAVGPVASASDADLEIDASGNKHLLYRNPEGLMMWSQFNAGSWSSDEVPFPASFTQPELTIDDQGAVHITHFVVSNGQVMDHTIGWSGSLPIAQVAQGFYDYGWMRELTSVASSTGTQFVAWNTGHPDGFRLGLSRRQALQSLFQLFGSSRTAIDPRSLSLAVGSDQLPWVAFIEGTAPSEQLRVMKYSLSGETQSLAMTGNFGKVSLALNSVGQPRIAYTEATGAEGEMVLKYREVGTSWSSPVTVDGSLGTIEDVSLALNGSTPNIAYIGNGMAKIAERNGSNWSYSPVENMPDGEGPVAVRFQSTGERWITYFDRAAKRLRVAGPPQGGEDPPCAPCDPDCDPCPILPAIDLQPTNPIRVGDALRFAVRLPRAAQVEMSLLDVSGRRVASRAIETLPAGDHQLEWRIRPVNPGVYFLLYRIAGQKEGTKQVVMVR